MDYKIAVRNYILKKQAQEKNKEDLNIQQLSKDLDFALSRIHKEAGITKNILVGLAMAAALFNSNSAKANADQMNKLIASLDGIGNGVVKVHNHLTGNTGRYTIDVGPYSLDGNYSSVGKGTVKKVKHELKFTLDSKADPTTIKEYKPIAEKLNKLLKTETIHILEK